MWKTSCLYSEIKSFTENPGTYKEQENSIPWRLELPIRNRKCVVFTFLDGQLRNNNYFSLRHSSGSEISDTIYLFIHTFSYFMYLFVCVCYACAGECNRVGDERPEKDMRHPGRSFPHLALLKWMDLKPRVSQLIWQVSKPRYHPLSLPPSSTQAVGTLEVTSGVFT